MTISMSKGGDNTMVELRKHKLDDISENDIREKMPEVLDILLIDRTRSTTKKNQNIIWANDNYIQFGGKAYAPEAQIKPELVTGVMGSVIMPRALKTRELQKERTKSKAEVFTPTWVVKKQNDAVDKRYSADDLETYINRTWLEITCGEAPYMVSRYDMDTGVEISLAERVGFIDRKLRRISDEIDERDTWQSLVEAAYKSSFGFEWSGDSLLLARENLLYTYRDYFVHKWNEEPAIEHLKTIAKIISYNIFQMDGLKLIVPLSEIRVKVAQQEISLFDDPDDIHEEWITKPGKRVKVMNWSKNKMEFFDKGIA
ncbi:type II restriction endonuclease [Lactiplantibacillus fabifermentans T30PCM01]|uniref:Type II restriction endonuclease n=1 Tax=Lactiplantibacillus fabifermentans T30PCM01 TaxID=1400520 RepID=W6TCV8_9LACO|nr:restriction endonuclease [Lactiplantibacillus fabifermentans]ETY75065.1 type II restriction endonuclease [Lactiplantibacillus fabifermentans T30PCM01]